MQANSIHELVALLDDDVDRWVLLRAALRLIPEQKLKSPITVGPKCGKDCVFDWDEETGE